ncbi:hypothetical protein GOHSU_17_00420 [Gordonia hirsuta DSM 44140 = NBRC 16056]|uniref:Phosphoenolpyruvate guanylyltransferase n=1 Tax=Gordonia hirsuta DSM 44140 = NBRC 16056 TaxID=1121927 RepID=L7LB26_9ACTN|nr:2-phospho-L-lactate guanylyltransferase [Gordonia hirsuta]GAC57238.1 hypothetical protein GOHSU_17_00420 [Gordonia hirsuta DSM 44140 = NBRC 16056]
MAPSSPAFPDLTVVLALKQLRDAKSRLTHPAVTHRQALVLAMFTDTVLAAQAVRPGRIVVVSPDPAVREHARALGVQTVDEPAGGGLNAALVHGAAGAPGAVAFLQADLPALRAGSLQQALTAAGDHPAAFVADREGSGTTLLVRAHRTALHPSFGPGSAQAHRRAGAVELDPAHRRWPDLRRDADTVEDLAACAALGLGSCSQQVLSSSVSPSSTRRPARASSGDREQ